MNDELQLLRAFRAQDATVEASSAHAARAALMAHISEPSGGSGRQARAGRRRRPVMRVSSGVIAIGLVIAVIVVVGAVFLGLRGHSAARRHPATPHGRRPPVLRNLAPARPPKLPGQLFCNAALARPDAIPGLGGAHSAVIVVNAARIHGVNESPFSITARGLAPSVRAGGYAVWILQVTGLTSTAAPVPGAKPVLLGVVTPGVGKDGRLTAEGLLPPGVSGDYLVRITRQARSSITKPGRTVLTGVAQL